ncbi:putative hydrogen peroxide-inducible genes activator [Dinoroseobacter shibae DFL 12 = DSM 16493]|jgi:LysR family hydrogen peroxide-inducible transcriptional activator|uniref:Putative hydrogen peroxide-inducible genes activator n=1 Tax=Dinoroseobacter shibae (strain DSM 16493 / NCIMB 14021 / DFL 12) TaxID=398580 RepID=A8LSQ7_DINSH|nr:hydrogen peroxide-inducible genes activator [Dinoroseobacter shibae]ABV94256.1 putative hydrogen peroxide-inducible genes activator [Dinoroseobacter shibae DFL 12 = DSM 16493]URF45694.1 hydrogen peroxide-inducible genes activator [Dinoroseobacter shibae]URF49999.1 hydrogen peroxide-inducible genes activator [Dinoroseobacter shibae]
MTTLRQLRFLAALDDTGNFSRAAELCHVTQSTLSTGLKELEERLGIKVAERTKQSVMMTPVGRDLAERARAILAQVQDFEQRAARENAAGASVLRLGAIPTVGPFLMPRAMPLLRRALPETKFYLREELTEPLVAGLLEGRLDLLLLALPHPLPTQIEAEVLFSDGYRLATPTDHPLGNRSSVGADDLDDRQLLLLEKGHCLQRHAISSFSGINLDEDQSFSATSLSTLVAMVEEDLGITLLPNLAVDAGISQGHRLHLGRVDGACPRRVALAWRKSSPNIEVFRKIGACLKAARADLQNSPAAA